MSYNLSFTNTSNNLADIAIGMSSNLGPMFGSIILFIVWLTFYAMLSRNGASTAFVGSGLVSTSVGISLMFAGIVTWQALVTPVVFLALGSLYLFWNDRN